MSSVRQTTSKAIVTNVYKEEFDKACKAMSKSQRLSNGDVAFFYSKDATYFDILDPINKTVIRIKIIDGKGQEVLHSESAFLAENRWLLVNFDNTTRYLILDKQENYQVTYESGFFRFEFRQFMDVDSLFHLFLRNLRPLKSGSSQFTALAGLNTYGYHFTLILCEVRTSGIVILDTLPISTKEEAHLECYNVLSPTEIALVLSDTEGYDKIQFYYITVKSNKLTKSNPINFELNYLSEKMVIKKIDQTVTMHGLNSNRNLIYKYSLDPTEEKQLPQCDSTLINDARFFTELCFIPNSNFIITNNKKTLVLWDTVNHVMYPTQVDTTNLLDYKVLDNGLIFVIRTDGAIQLFKYEDRTEEILNYAYPPQNKAPNATHTSLTQYDMFPLPRPLGGIVLAYYGIDFLVEVTTPRRTLASKPLISAAAESKRHDAERKPEVDVCTSELESERDPFGETKPESKRHDAERKPEVDVCTSELESERDPFGETKPESKRHDAEREPEVDVCTEAQGKKVANMLNEGYISWYKLSIFGHHHNDRAIVVRNAIRSKPTEAMKFINHQIDLFDGKPVEIIPELGERWSRLHNKDKAGFYKLLLKMRGELNGVTPTEAEEEKSTNRCLPW